MDLALCLLLVTVSTVSATGTLGAGAEGCKSPQYIQIGGTGVIHCTFRQDFYGVLWYNSSETNLEVAFLQLIDNEKSGYGYSSGKYDVSQNGSLIIKNVSAIHDQTFTALKFASSDEDPVSFPVDVITTVKSKQDQPFIDVCGSDLGLCFALLDFSSVINCFIRGVRPAVNLTWFARTSEGDRNISFATNLTHDGITYTSNALISNFFQTKLPLRLLVCKAYSPPGILRKNEMLVLVENGNISAEVKPIEISVHRGHKMKLLCSESKVDIIVWKKLGEPFKILSNAVLFRDNISQVYSDEYELDREGSLIVSHAGVKHEGIYECSFGEGTFGGKQHLNVVVYVSAYPVISGCTPNDYCALNVHPEGNLSCSVTGIRPRVQLQWDVPTERYSSVITFSDREETVIHNGEAFDIHMTSKYRIGQIPTGNRLTVECGISATKTKALESRRQVELLFITDQLSNGRKAGAKFHYLWLLLVVTFFVVLCVFTIRSRRTRKRNRRRQVKEIELQSPDTNEVDGMNTLMEHPSGSMLGTLTEGLKAMYTSQYVSVLPAMDTKLCVNSIFVDGGYKLMTSRSSEGENFRTLKEVLQRIDIPSVVVIEGGPGSGKTTLALQLAYDWCHGIQSSPIHDKDILILLRLKDVEGGMSVYKAIKEQILPTNSSLSETDIRHVLLGCNSAVLILDGFDEYPGLSTSGKSDIMSIVMGEMFQWYLVLITTRSFSLLKSRLPKSYLLKLTGFDEESRDQYIRKAIAKYDSQEEDRIKRGLHNVPITDLLKIPLLFTIIGHYVSVEQGGEQDFNFLSSIAKLIITCLHTHMEMKMLKKDRNAVKSYQQTHTELDDVAFQIVSGRHKPSWRKRKICKLVGEDFYDYYKRVGILVENVVYNYDILRPVRKAEFLHELLCEWYAAHCLIKKFKECELGFRTFLGSMHFFKFRNVFLLACRLDKDFADKTVKYLAKNKVYENFAFLCFVESARKIDEMSNEVHKILEGEVILDINQDKLLTWSTIQLLMVASREEMPISCLQLKAYKSPVEFSDGVLYLQADICLPYLTTLKELVIYEFVDMQTTDETHILKYSSMCENIESLKFYRCNVAKNMIQEACLTSLKSRNVSVVWVTLSSSFSMNLQSGLWENREGTPLTEEKYAKEVKEIQHHLGPRPSTSRDGEDK